MNHQTIRQIITISCKTLLNISNSSARTQSTLIAKRDIGTRLALLGKLGRAGAREARL